MFTPDDVLTVEFPESGMRAGYDTDEVDAYLDDVVLAMRAGEPLPPWNPAEVPTVRRQGYQFAEVDAFLRSLGVLDADAGAQTERVGDDSVGGRSAPGGSAAAGEERGPTVQPGNSDQSRPGLLRRLFGGR